MKSNSSLQKLDVQAGICLLNLVLGQPCSSIAFPTGIEDIGASKDGVIRRISSRCRISSSERLWEARETRAKAIFDALAENTGLKELKVNLQAFGAGSFRESMSKKAWRIKWVASWIRSGWRGLQGSCRGLPEQPKPCEAGSVDASKEWLSVVARMLLQRHWQDQICRGLMQNKQASGLLGEGLGSTGAPKRSRRQGRG